MRLLTSYQVGVRVWRLRTEQKAQVFSFGDPYILLLLKLKEVKIIDFRVIKAIFIFLYVWTPFYGRVEFKI